MPRLATTNRLPVLLLASDIFATRVSSPVLQELELPSGYDISVNDAFRPLSRFFDRVWRPEQLPQAMLGAMRVLTDPAETGAVTLALPQDVQAEGHDWPEELFAEAGVVHPAAGAGTGRAGPGGRRDPLGPAAVDRRRRRGASTARRPRRCAGSPRPPASRSPTLRPARAASGGITRRPSAGSVPPDLRSPTRWPGRPTWCIGIGTRYSDFTTASRTAFQNPDVRFVNLNVTALDAAKHSGVMLVADARDGLEALHRGAGRAIASTMPTPRSTASTWIGWNTVVDKAYHLDHGPLPAQTEVLGALNETIGTERDRRAGRRVDAG